MSLGYKLFFFWVIIVIPIVNSQFVLNTSGKYGIVGSPFTFTCLIDFPIPEVSWYENDTEYRMYTFGDECHPRSRLPKDYTFNCSQEISTLTINSVNTSQHGTVWRCGFRHGSSPQSNTVVLDVRGGPDGSIHFHPSPALHLEEGNDLAVKCAADCFLRCDYTWTFRGKTVSNTSTLSIAEIERSQDGTYTCTAVNPDTGKTANKPLRVRVRFFATLTGSGRYGIVGSPFTFTCKTEPSPEVTWYENDTEYNMHELGNGKCHIHRPIPREYTFNCSHRIYTLTINSVKISQQGTVWRCQGYPWKPKSNTLVLEVREGPNSPIRISKSSPLFVEEGNDLTVSCAADCFLRCDYTWTHDGRTASNTSTLSIRGIDRSQAGTYSCTAVNPDTGKTAAKEIFIDVRYSPVIASLQLKTVDTKDGFHDACSATLTCTADSNPTSKMTLIKGGQLLLEMNNVTSLEYIWNKTACQRSGTFTCEADNSILPSAKQTLQLPVQWFPEKGDNRFGAGFGSGLGTTIALLVLIGVIALLYIRVKRARNIPKQTQESREEAELQPVSNVAINLESSNGREGQGRAGPETNNSMYSSLGASGHDAPYDVLEFPPAADEDNTYQNA